MRQRERESARARMKVVFDLSKCVARATDVSIL